MPKVLALLFVHYSSVKACSVCIQLASVGLQRLATLVNPDESHSTHFLKILKCTDYYRASPFTPISYASLLLSMPKENHERK